MLQDLQFLCETSFTTKNVMYDHVLYGVTYTKIKMDTEGHGQIAVPGEVILIEHTQNTPGPLYPSHGRILRLCALRGSCSRRCPKSHP